MASELNRARTAAIMRALPSGPEAGSHSISALDPDRLPIATQSTVGYPEISTEEVEEESGSESGDTEQERLDAAHATAVARTAAERRKRDIARGYGIPPTPGGKPGEGIVDPTKDAASGMSIYDAGVEAVRAERGDEAAEAARKDMAHADLMRARKEHGEVESSSDDYYERVKTDDGQDWLVDRGTGEVIRTTGMSHEAVGAAYYTPRIQEALTPPWDHVPFQSFISRAKEGGVL